MVDCLCVVLLGAGRYLYFQLLGDRRWIYQTEIRSLLVIIFGL